MSFKEDHRPTSEVNDQSKMSRGERRDGDRYTDSIPEMSKLDQYQMIEKLGQGTFGVVQKARNKRTGDLVAIKQLLNHSAKEGFPITAMREITILKQLDHHNILNIADIIFAEPDVTNPADVITQRGSFYTVAPYMTSDLVGILENPDIHLQLNQIKCIMTQLFEGIQYIHEQNYLHRDIKAANILIDNKGVLKIADFGLARFYHGDVPRLGMGPGGGEKDYTALVVTRWYRPPELLLGERKYTTAVDLWGVGCVFAELFVGKPILVGKSDVNQAQLIFELIGSPENWDQAFRLPNKSHFNIGVGCKRSLERRFESVMPPSAVSLLSGLLRLDPYKRLNSLDALNHEFFKTEPLPILPEQMPQFGECHEIDKERFKKLKESNYVSMKSESRTYLEDKRWEHEDPNSFEGTGNRDGYDDYGKNYVRRTHSRHDNENAFEDRRRNQKVYPGGGYYDDRGRRNQDSWREDEYIDNDFGDERAPYNSLDYGGPRTFESKQLYPYVPRSERIESHSRRESPRPLSRTENRQYNPIHSRKINGVVNYSERRSPSRFKGTPGNFLSRESSREPEKAFVGEGNTRITANENHKHYSKPSDDHSNAGSSPSDVSSVIEMDYQEHDNEEEEKKQEKEQEKEEEKKREQEQEQEKEKEKEKEKAEDGRRKAFDNSFSSETSSSKSRRDYISPKRERFNATEKEDTRSVDSTKKKDGRDFSSGHTTGATKEQQNVESKDSDVPEKATTSVLQDTETEPKQVTADKALNTSFMERRSLNQESNSLGKEVLNKEHTTDNKKVSANKTGKYTVDERTRENHSAPPGREPTIEPQHPRTGNAAKPSNLEGFGSRNRNRSMPYVHGGWSERVATTKKSPNRSVSPVSKESRTGETTPKFEVEKTPAPQSSALAQVKGAELGKPKLFQTPSLEANRPDRHVSRTTAASKEVPKKDLFGKPKTSTVPINHTRPTRVERSSRNLKENVLKRELVSHAMRASKRAKKNYSYVDDTLSESDLSDVEDFPEKGKRHDLYRSFLNEEGYMREPIYRKHLNEARRFTR